MCEGQGCCWGVQGVSQEHGLCKPCLPREVAVGGGVYILHGVWVSVHPRVHTPDAFALAVWLSAPRGGFAEQPGQETAQSESSLSRSPLAPRCW